MEPLGVGGMPTTWSEHQSRQVRTCFQRMVEPPAARGGLTQLDFAPHDHHFFYNSVTIRAGCTPKVI